MSFFEKLMGVFSNVNSKNSDNKKITSKNQIIDCEDSILKKIYEINGCYRCNLKITGLGFNQYICDVIIMEKELLVFHLINRDNLNISCILAPIAATAFATSFNNNESSNIFKGEWIILPFHHIATTSLTNNNEASILTKSGINYIIRNNKECVLKILNIHNEKLKDYSLEKESEICVNNKKQLLILNANTAISKTYMEIDSIKEITPYANQFPCCIVSISNKQLAKILTSDLFYAKYILDPQETFNLIISEWDGHNNKLDNSFFLKQGASRKLQYKRKIGTGIMEIWVPFNEKHQIFYCKNYSYIHILINVDFIIFEKNICIKILLRIVALQDNKSQLDVECELENTSALSYLVRYQLESTTISNIQSTVQKYIRGIETEMIILNNENAGEKVNKESKFSPEYKLNEKSFKESNIYCSNTTCCFEQLYSTINNALNF